ncbi:MAG: hypothetical protein AAB447_04095 [Patescibacteria group bacterium]
MEIKLHTEGLNRYIGKLGKNPEADWKLLFVCFIALAVSLLAFSGVMLYRINAGEIFLAEKKDTQELRTIDRERLKELISAFKLSDRQYQLLKADRPVLVDPGL